jgi:hypothetical protein
MRALDFLRANFTNVTTYLGTWGDPFTAEMQAWEGDYIIN